MTLSFLYTTPFGRTQQKTITAGKLDVQDEPFKTNHFLPFLDVVSYHGKDMSEIKYDVTGWMVSKGSGRGALEPSSQNISLKKSAIVIKNDNTICAAGAVVTTMANIHKDLHTESQIKNGFNTFRGLQLR